jgi:acyl-coenzyme A thioesterase PaaI-like protein
MHILLLKAVNEILKEVHNQQPHNMHSSLNFIRVIKSRKVRWVGHVEHMGKSRIWYEILIR